MDLTLVSVVVDYLVKNIKEKKPLQDFFSNFSSEAINWIRPLFLKEDNTYQTIIDDLYKKPESSIKRGQVELAIASYLEDNPYLQPQFQLLLNHLTLTSEKNTGLSKIISEHGIISWNEPNSISNVYGDGNVNITSSGSSNINIQGIQGSDINLY